MPFQGEPEYWNNENVNYETNKAWNIFLPGIKADKSSPEIYLPIFIWCPVPVVEDR